MPTHGQAIEALHIKGLASVVADLTHIIEVLYRMTALVRPIIIMMIVLGGVLLVLVEELRLSSILTIVTLLIIVTLVAGVCGV